MRLINGDELLEEIKSMKIWLRGKDIFPPEAKESIVQLIEDEPTVYYRSDAEEEAENRLNRVLDDEKRISYEQGRKNERENIMDIIYSAEDDAHAMFLLGQHFMIEQLKEKKNE